MSVRPALLAWLARCDEDALVALSNRGLYRRAMKDLDAISDIRMDDEPAGLVVHLGQFAVRFDERGPAFAKCPCPSVSTCQHILAAALWLKAQSAVEAPSANRHLDAVVASPDAAALATSLAAIDTQSLRKHAGAAGFRWALEYVRQLDLERDVTLECGGHVSVRFAHPPVTFRYLGGGLEQMIADVPLPRIAKYRVAAALVVRRLVGIACPDPDGGTIAFDGRPPEGTDTALGHGANADQTCSRQRLRRAVRTALVRGMELGLAHVSRSTAATFAGLATWARGCRYYRLALALRRIADHVDSLLARAGLADEHRLLDEITIAYALVCALDVAAAKRYEPAHLVGRGRRRFDATATIECVGLGAFPWRSASGYVGLSVLLWAPDARRFLVWTDARPEVQGRFDPVQRHHTTMPWEGSTTPSELAGRRVVLRHPEVSPDGRIASVERTSVVVSPLVDLTALRTSLEPMTDWGVLAEHRRRAQRSLLAEPRPARDWVALLPSRFEQPVFDPTRQTLVVPLIDARGQALPVEVRYSKLTTHALARLACFHTQRPDEGTVLMGRLASGDRGLYVEPVSLIAPKQDGRAATVDSIHFDGEPADLPGGWGDVEAFRSTPADGGVRGRPGVPATTTPLDGLRDWIRHHAERGVSGTHPSAIAHAWCERAGAVRAAGFRAFSATLAADLSPAEALLRANYLILQCLALLHADAIGSEEPM